MDEHIMSAQRQIIDRLNVVSAQNEENLKGLKDSTDHTFATSISHLATKTNIQNYGRDKLDALQQMPGQDRDIASPPQLKRDPTSRVNEQQSQGCQPFHFSLLVEGNSFSSAKRYESLIKLLASNLGEPGSLSGGIAPRIFARGNRAGQCRCSAHFLWALPFLHVLAHRCCSILTSNTDSSDLKTSKLNSRRNISTFSTLHGSTNKAREPRTHNYGHSGFSHVVIVPDDAVDRWFPPPFHSGAAPYSPQSPTSALKTSILRTAQISSLHLNRNRNNAVVTGRGETNSSKLRSAARTRAIFFAVLAQRNTFFDPLAIEWCNIILNVDDRFGAAMPNCVSPDFVAIGFYGLPPTTAARPELLGVTGVLPEWEGGSRNSSEDKPGAHAHAGTHARALAATASEAR
ncbi:hypothetical protein PR048_015782 [Dryococelus australis]|uniref:t-SNARE coiled-coil homology domain-containing protein n=1 Tax=Dryococelus australis TaxID=614101 RepID=A0ABQ9HI46_9NEOP|nr:hypothetical protein PR048_015782 [Dryococelus australis]